MSNINEQKAIEYYLKKKPDIDKMIINDVIDNGIAFIPCKVSGMNDIICKFSVKEHETLDNEFADYIKSYANDIPTKYPIALAICGHKFTDTEQKTIAEVIKDYFTYELGLIRQKNQKSFILFIIMTLVMVVSGILLRCIPDTELTLIEYLYIFFWGGADICFAFLLFNRREDKKNRILASRLSSLFIYFDETYDDSKVSDEEANYIKKEIFSK